MCLVLVWYCCPFLSIEVLRWDGGYVVVVDDGNDDEEEEDEEEYQNVPGTAKCKPGSVFSKPFGSTQTSKTSKRIRLAMKHSTKYLPSQEK